MHKGLTMNNNAFIKKSTIRGFSITLLSVSLLSYRMPCFPLSLWQDVVLVLILAKLLPVPLLFLLSLLASLCASAELVAATKGFDIPWRLSSVAMRNWRFYVGLIQAELLKDTGNNEETYLGLGLVWESIIIVSVYLTLVIRQVFSRKAKRGGAYYKMLVCLGLSCFILYWGMGAVVLSTSRSCHVIGTGNKNSKRHNDVSTRKNNRGLLHHVTSQMWIGYRQDQALRSKLKKTPRSNLRFKPAVASNKPNVVFVILESLRSDMMPFDKNSVWAKQNLRKGSPPVTPFYDKFTTDNNTVFWPKIQSASGFTHKSMMGLFCSLYAMPQEMTREHDLLFHHKCLPEILSNEGYATKLFQGMTRDFDHQMELSQRMGFFDLYGMEDLIDAQPKGERERFKEKYNSGWGSLEDLPFLDPMLGWIDEQHQNHIPFFLSYATSVTHFPYPTPKNNWTALDFSDDTKHNSWLNTVAYTDKFLKEFVHQIFDKRPGVAKNTLFVVVGDHGVDLLDHGRRTAFEVTQQVAYEVGLSFYSKNFEMSNMLDFARPHVFGNWSSLDVAPTILSLLKIPVLNPFESQRHQQSRRRNIGRERPTYHVMDGRSMFQSSGSRLILSITNPGEGLVLKDGNLILVQIKNVCYLYDLQKDPWQKSPTVAKDCLDLTKEEETKNSNTKWSQMAVPFISAVRSEIEEDFHGIRNPNGVLQKLLTWETLLQEE